MGAPGQGGHLGGGGFAAAHLSGQAAGQCGANRLAGGVGRLGGALGLGDGGRRRAGGGGAPGIPIGKPAFGGRGDRLWRSGSEGGGRKSRPGDAAVARGFTGVGGGPGRLGLLLGAHGAVEVAAGRRGDPGHPERIQNIQESASFGRRRVAITAPGRRISPTGAPSQAALERMMRRAWKGGMIAVMCAAQRSRASRRVGPAMLSRS